MFFVFVIVWGMILLVMLDKLAPPKRRYRRSEDNLSGCWRAQAYMGKMGHKTPRIMRSGKFW